MTIWKNPYQSKKKRQSNTACHLSSCPRVRTNIWVSPSHTVDQWLVKALLTLINRPIYNSSVWDSSSSLHLGAGLGSDSCLAGIHRLEGRIAIRLLTACLGFPGACHEKGVAHPPVSVCIFSKLSSRHICKPHSVSTCLYFSLYVNLYCLYLSVSGI